MVTEHMTQERRDEFDAWLNPPPPKSPEERLRERLDAIIAAGGEVTM